MKATINKLQLFSERLLVPTGSSGFRITTKIHPFWTVYLNGLGIAIAKNTNPSEVTAHTRIVTEQTGRTFLM